MALANFFDKIALGASQVLQNYDRKEFEEVLLSHKILILFDDNAVTTKEGRATLDLLIRLIARLYPIIQIENVDGDAMVDQLKKISEDINPQIYFFESGNPTACIVVGNTPYSGGIPTIYVGSDNWIMSFSSNNPIGSVDSNNPFGAGAAACMAAANLFRLVLKKYLPHSQIDKDFTLSLLDFSIPASKDKLIIESFDLDDALLVGLGAIGNGFIWAINYLTEISGTLTLIDHEKISISNLQRYVLATQNNVTEDLAKTELAIQILKDSKLNIIPAEMTWSDYVNKRNDWRIETIITCVDNAEARIMAQGSLPRKIFNAWTQPENLGISRHTDFINNACLCCLYFPTGKKISRSQEMADNLSVPELFIRDYLANNKPIDEIFINTICSFSQKEASTFSQYIGKSVDIFYSGVVCGGILINLNNSANGKGNQIAVPSAFESAFAGILLAAELVKDKLNFKTNNKLSTRFNLIRPITKYLNEPELKNPFCICNDQIFQNSFTYKWSNI